MALIGAAFGIGFTFGPLVGFASLEWFPEHHGAIGYTAAGLSLIALLLGIRLLPETRRFGTAPPVRTGGSTGRPFAMFFPVLPSPPCCSPSSWPRLDLPDSRTLWPCLLKDAMQFSMRENFLIFAYIGFVLVMTQGFLYRRLARRLTEATFMAVGILLMGLGVLVWGVSASGPTRERLPGVCFAVAAGLAGAWPWSALPSLRRRPRH